MALMPVAGCAAMQAQGEVIIEESVVTTVVAADVPRLPGPVMHTALAGEPLAQRPLPPERPLLPIYAFPQSHTLSHPDWRRMWVNTAVLTGCFVSTLMVLECLPDDATSWNRDELQSVPLFKRWKQHVITWGPKWDHDNPVFNFVLHPYAGAAYFMGARSCGFNFWQSMLYSFCISSIGWEFGIEAFMEQPSWQDLFITPVVGSFMGEAFYMLKHHIVNHGYRLWGSPVLGNVVAFIIDPVNEVVGLFAGNPARHWARRHQAELRSAPGPIVLADGSRGFGLTLTARF